MKHIVIAALSAVALIACSPPTPAEEPAPATLAVAAAASDTLGESVLFTAPSGNIGCTYTPAGGTAVYQPAAPGAELQCDRNEPEYVRIVMSEQGAAQITPTDERGCCSGEAIAYGDRWNEGPFTCDVTEAGVTCTSTAGHGFTLSRSRADVH
jgi:hypothetical protein